RLGESDRLVILKKPFDTAEICQLAAALTAKHRLAAAARLKLDELEAKVAERTADLKRINEQLAAEVEQRRRAEAQLRHDVLHDRLTSLPNRAMLLDRLEKCIQRQKTEPGFQFAVLFLDLDDFKVVNDSLGHEAGDTLLMEVSRRLLEAVRQSRQDTAEQRFAEGLTARLGGDEFVVLLEGLTRPEHALLVADRIKQRMAEPIELSGREVVVSQSIGVATGRPEYTRAAEILRDADIAVYQAKGKGKNGYALFDARMHAEAQQRLEIEIELRKAVQSEQFTIVYQPIISLSSGRLEGFEALLRWTHPTRGVIPPHRFIPLAESTGLIGSLGAWVLREVCRQALRWRVRFAEQYPQLWISVNLSGRQLQMNDLPEQIEQIIAHSGVDRSALRLEVTESVLMQQGDGSLATLAELRRRGLALAMDDFGTGYSSLSRLHQLPISTIKIDQSFVREMSVSGRSYTATVQAIIMLAHNCGFSVVAEGVETPEQLAQLQALDCDSAQGFLLSQPLDVVGAEALLAQPAQPGACKQFLYRRAG
ncbi:MAG TPA: EAL domain-containing protein, partial [Tepidisphaeraceae bacterium]|nr:EAL domain-containing protein [Tepidisphaeraceae bacterium]